MQDLAPRVCSDAGDLCLDLGRGLRRTIFDPQWYRPSSLSELVAVARDNQGKRIRMVAGDTGRGQSQLQKGNINYKSKCKLIASTVLIMITKLIAILST